MHRSAVFLSQNLHLCERLFKAILIAILTNVIEFKHIISQQKPFVKAKQENSQKTWYDKVFSRQNFSTRRAIK